VGYGDKQFIYLLFWLRFRFFFIFHWFFYWLFNFNLPLKYR
jgi:hypothetical protein